MFTVLLQNEGMVLLLTDSQIVDERMMVPVNDVLAGADVADLYPPEDREEIVTAMRAEAKAAGLEDSNDVCWRLFMQRARANLHVVLTASPVGDALRLRSQRFLATINATVVDWVHPWPEASLHRFAKGTWVYFTHPCASNSVLVNAFWTVLTWVATPSAGRWLTLLQLRLQPLRRWQPGMYTGHCWWSVRLRGVSHH